MKHVRYSHFPKAPETMRGPKHFRTELAPPRRRFKTAQGISSRKGRGRSRSSFFQMNLPQISLPVRSPTAKKHTLSSRRAAPCAPCFRDTQLRTCACTLRSPTLRLCSSRFLWTRDLAHSSRAVTLLFIYAYARRYGSPKRPFDTEYSRFKRPQEASLAL